ncbi:MAG: HEAT repeat domain-containing protein [Deltaproteobacteria bacterium]|jgi:AAA family ATP:ADP antiporter|nr:HEAT repeat domain-containing protein [Deltaproteobacteria bacterium]
MRRFLARVLDIRPGEGALVIRSTAVLFGLICAHTVLETARDALFLQKISASRLPFVYALLAGLALFVARFNTAFVARFGRRNALIFTLLGAAYGTVVLYRLPPSAAVIFALYTWSALLGTILVAQFWMLAGQAFTVAQGKRLFGPITAGGVLGAVVGAGSAVAALQVMPVTKLLLGSTAAFLVTAVVLTTLESDAGETTGVVTTVDDQVPGFFRELRARPYLGRLVVLVGLSTGAVLVADYLFKSVVAKSMPAADLGAFFAVAYAVMNTIALVVQLFLSQYLVRRLGVIAAFGILPSFLLLGGAATLLTNGAIWATLLIKGADGSLRHSLHRIATELLWMPLPEDVRTRVKTFVDTVLVRGVQAVTAALLLVLAMVGADGPVPLAVLILVLASSWVFLTIQLRRPYLDLFRTALQRPTATGAGLLRLDLESVEVVVEALSSRDPARALAAIELLVHSKRTRLIPALILYHEAESVLLRALEVIGTKERKEWVPLAQRLLQHPSDAVRVAAVRSLARVGDGADLEGRLYDVSPGVRGHAAFWVAERAGGAPHEHPAVQIVLGMGGNAGRTAQLSLLEAMSGNGHPGWSDVLLELCQRDDPQLLEAGAKAVQRCGDQRFLPLMIERLKVRQGRSAVREAIVGMGEVALDALEVALDDPATDRMVRRHLPRTISRFQSQRAADILMRTLERENEGHVRYKALRGLGRLVESSPVRVDHRRVELQVKTNLIEHLRILSLLVALRPALSKAPPAAQPSGELLIGLLEDKRVQALDRAFRLLQVVHRREDVRSTSVAVSSSDKRLRAQALEYLDALTLYANVSEIRDLFRVVADELPDQERVSRSREFLPKIPADLDEALTMLLKDRDHAVVGITAHFVMDYGPEELRLDVSTISRDGVRLPSLESLIREFEARGLSSVA